MSTVSFSIGRLQGLYGDKKALEVALELGADGVDFDLLSFDLSKEGNVYAKSEQEIRQYFADIKAHADSIGIKIVQTHGRIVGFKNKKEEDDLLIRNGELDCIATAELGAKYCVMHTTTTIHMGPNVDEELMYALNYDMYARLLPYAKREKIKIATETFGDATGLGCIDFFGDAEHFIKGYEQVKKNSGYGEWFCICMDTGHSNKSTRFENNPPVGEFIRRLGSEIEVLHLNDNDTLTDQHKIPMTGTLDWADIMQALKDIGYSGAYNMEIVLNHFGADFALEEARFAIKVMRQMLKRFYGEQ